MKMLGVLLAMGAILAGGTAALAINVCAYQSPETALVDARVALNYRYYDDAATAGVDVHSGRIALDYDQIFDSPSFGFSLAGTAEVPLERFVPTGGLGQAAATFRYYWAEGGSWFVYGGSEALYSSGWPGPGVDVSLGVGVGRFSDVTPLAKAIEIDDELVHTGALANDLGDDVLLEIATIIGREIEFDTIKDWVSEIELVIETAAAVELDARALLFIEELLLHEGDQRRCGWAVQAGIGYELIDPFGAAGTVIVKGSADAALAPGPSDQLMLHVGVTGPFDILDEHTMNASARYQRNINEDSTLLLNYVLQRAKPAGGTESTNHAATASIGFDVSGVDITLGASLSKSAGDPGWSLDISVGAAMELL
ncbi:hypothetical protein JW848_09265 [Candidatus Bipolaricaulota bacterium]|nr:hypothetical protein [Candidatus Bipolaricaulota bacterium]